MTTSSAPLTTRRPTHAELEASLEAYFRRAVRSAGGMLIKLAPTERGVPDRMVLLPGGVLALVELKASGGRLSAIQQVWHTRAAELGTEVVVLTGRSQIDEWVRSRFSHLVDPGKRNHRKAPAYYTIPVD